MSRRPCRNHALAFKAKVAIEALADGRTIAEIAHKHEVHPNPVTRRRRQPMERAAGAFGGAVTPEVPPVDLQVPHAKIGQLALETDLFGGCAQQGRAATRQAMIERHHDLAGRQPRAARLAASAGHQGGRRPVATLMRRMGILAQYSRPNTSKRDPALPVFP